MDKQIIEPLSLKAEQPLWLRVTLGIVLFVVVGAVYFIAWGFWVGMSHWADTIPNTMTTDQFYLQYIWGPLLVIFLIIPTILTFLKIRWRLKIVYWFTSFVLALLSWFVWFIVIEATSK
jgi:hypothetical protein